MVYGVWCMEYGVWCMVYGYPHAEADWSINPQCGWFWSEKCMEKVCCLWYIVCYVACVVYGVWCMVYGFWCVVYCVLCMVCHKGTYLNASDVWEHYLRNVGVCSWYLGYVV